MEVHDNPAVAKSDGANALRLDQIRGVLAELLAVRRAVSGNTTNPDVSAHPTRNFD
jgi:2-dehydro-3-deoxyphosphooctonate aldolase (KDO 8-P synthase)